MRSGDWATRDGASSACSRRRSPPPRAIGDARQEWYGRLERAREPMLRARRRRLARRGGARRFASSSARRRPRARARVAAARARRHDRLALRGRGRRGERALAHARRAGDARRTARARRHLCTALLYGPAPRRRSARCERMLLATPEQRPSCRANVVASLAGLARDARRLRRGARARRARPASIYDELGLRARAAGLDGGRRRRSSSRRRRGGRRARAPDAATRPRGRRHGARTAIRRRCSRSLLASRAALTRPTRARSRSAPHAVRQRACAGVMSRVRAREARRSPARARPRRARPVRSPRRPLDAARRAPTTSPCGPRCARARARQRDAGVAPQARRAVRAARAMSRPPRRLARSCAADADATR